MRPRERRVSESGAEWKYEAPARGHTHGKPHNIETGNLRLAFALNLLFTLIELVGGLYTNSIAILSDALHDFGDSISLGVAWFLSSYAGRGRDRVYSYGYRRFSLLSAAISGLVLVLGSLYILSEAIPRLLAPERSNAEGMIVLALIGIAVNGAAALRLRGGATLNVQTVAWHLLEDVLGWAAVLIVGITLRFTEIHILDPILSIVITGYVLFNVIRNLRRTLSVFLQSVPEHVDMDAIVAAIEKIEMVHSTHHVHIWSLDGAEHVLTAHVVVGEEADQDDVICIKNSIRDFAGQMNLEYTTIEVEYPQEDCRVPEE